MRDLIVVVAAVFLAGGTLGRQVGAQPAAGKTVNWALHNLDLAGSRYSTLDQITTSNVKSLTPRWLFQYGIIDGVSNQTTPVIVDGAYCTKTDMTCLPGGAMPGSIMDGRMMSI